MSGVLLAAAVAFLAGAAIAFQSPLASLMAERIGSLESAFVVHLGGAIAAGVPLLILGGGGLGRWSDVPWYALACGILGVVLIVGFTYTIPRIGVAATVAILVLAQLVVGSVLDHLGALEVSVRSFDLERAAGTGVILVGVWMMLR